MLRATVRCPIHHGYPGSWRAPTCKPLQIAGSFQTRLFLIPPPEQGDIWRTSPLILAECQCSQGLISKLLFSSLKDFLFEKGNMICTPNIDERRLLCETVFKRVYLKDDEISKVELPPLLPRLLLRQKVRKLSTQVVKTHSYCQRKWYTKSAREECDF